MVSLDTLEKLNIFSDFTDEELEGIQKICSQEEYQRDQRLFLEGDPAKDMWIVSSGDVELRFEMPDKTQTTKSNTLSAHSKAVPGSRVFGWSCFVPPYTMRLSAYCVSRECTIIKISEIALNKLMDAEAQIGYKIMQYLVKVVGFRFNQFQEEIAKFK
ncbi:MAG: cyclic nucleotide-binding domain-containing protein, partial [Desulfobacteraceae bacterium]|nr:cyclic nucleotide-binding domain-containing protein [Desulfobacteraceae bacterium]